MLPAFLLRCKTVNEPVCEIQTGFGGICLPDDFFFIFSGCVLVLFGKDSVGETLLYFLDFALAFKSKKVP